MDKLKIKLPDFLIIGAQKAGTSWLQRALSEHPSIYMPLSEVHYFDKAYNYKKGVKWYSTFFEEANGKQLIGEKTPDYFWPDGNGIEDHLPNVHININKLIPDVKLILSLRNPVDRAVSAVKHIIRSGRIHPGYSIDSLLVGDKQELISGHGVLEYGCYYKHLSAYLDVFDRSQILVLIFEEDIKDNPMQGLQKVYDFLDIPQHLPTYYLERKVNVHKDTLVELYTKYYLPRLYRAGRTIGHIFSKSIKPPSKGTLLKLEEFYSDKNEKLFDYLNRRVPDSWGKSAH